MSEKFWVDEGLVLEGWELREDGWYFLEKGDSAVRVLPYFKIRTHYIVKAGYEDEKYIEIVDKQGRTHIKKVKRNETSYMPTLEFMRSIGLLRLDKVREAKRFLAHYIQKAKRQRMVYLDFLGYRYRNGMWEIVVGGYDGNTRKALSSVFYDIDEENSYECFTPSIKGTSKTFKETYRKLFALDDPPLHFAIAHFLSWIAVEFLEESRVIPDFNPVLIFVGDSETGKSIRGKIAAGLYGNPAMFSFSFVKVMKTRFDRKYREYPILIGPFPFLECPLGIDRVSTTGSNEDLFFYLICNITNSGGMLKIPVLMEVVEKDFFPSPWLSRRSIVIKLTEGWKSNLQVLGEAVGKLDFHHGHILHYVKGLTEEDREWIEELAREIYNYKKLQELGDESFEDIRLHIALSLAAYTHFFLTFIQACTEEEINRKLVRIIDFVVEEIRKNQIDKDACVEEIMNFLSKVDEARAKGVELKELSFKQVCKKIGYTPSHRIGELLKKFFWKRYTEKKKDTESNRRGTKLVFTPSCLIELPQLSETDVQFSSIAPEVWYDMARLRGFREEEARIWMKVFRLRHGDRWIPILVRSLRLNELPQFQKFLDVVCLVCGYNNG